MANRYRTNPKYAKKYRTTNWPEYNRNLIQRGNFALLISPDVLIAWNQTSHKRKQGGQRLYSDIAIEIALTFRLLFKMSLRQTQGFIMALATLSKSSIQIPDYSTLSRRASSLQIKTPQPRTYGKNERVTMIVDSTGIKIFGENEWCEKKHKVKGRKAWRKLHLGIDDKGTIIAHELTTNKKGDALVASELIDQLKTDIGDFLGDGAYDSKKLLEKLANHNEGEPPNTIIPPRKDAIPSKNGNTKRDRNIQYIEQHGRRGWEKRSGYGIRNRVENTMYRYKTLIGRNLRSREFNNQKTETEIGVNLMNWMTHLGMPKTVEVF